jgi:hypothetical protein
MEFNGQVVQQGEISMADKKMTVTVEHFEVFFNGDVPEQKPAADKENEKKNNALGAMLVAPFTTNNVAAVRQFDLPQPEGSRTGALDLGDADFFDKVLFKNEPIADKFKLQLALTDLDISSKFEQVFLEVIKGVGGIGVKAVGNAFAGFATGFLLDKIRRLRKGVQRSNHDDRHRRNRARCGDNRVRTDDPIAVGSERYRVVLLPAGSSGSGTAKNEAYREKGCRCGSCDAEARRQLAEHTSRGIAPTTVSLRWNVSLSQGDGSAAQQLR